MRTAGIVPAAGASRRMGRPKALLSCPDGRFLAERQAAALRDGGCEPVAVVAGARAVEVRAGLPTEWTVVENPRWAEGRATSLQAGIRAVPDADAYLFLPVDAAGVRAETVRDILAAAAADPGRVLRPVHGGRKGNVLWVPRAAARDLLNLPPDARVDEWARPLAREWETSDAAVLRNINTPEDWAQVVDTLA